MLGCGTVSEDVAHLEAHRPALVGHCYRMLGSAGDAEDATQETMIRAWRNLDRFDGRASLRTWLYRIATNVCLDELTDRGRRARPMEEGSPSSGSPPPEALIQGPRTHWIEPIADARAIPADADPSERAMLRQSIRLAFVAALQNLAPKQRAVLLLMEVLGLSAAEVAETLETSVAAVNSAVSNPGNPQRPRSGSPLCFTRAAAQSLCRGVRAVRCRSTRSASARRCDVLHPALRTLVSGPGGCTSLTLGLGSGCRGSRLVPPAACGSPAFGQYGATPEGGHKPWA